MGGVRGDRTAIPVTEYSLCQFERCTIAPQHNITLRLGVIGYSFPWEEVVYGSRASIVSYMEK